MALTKFKIPSKIEEVLPTSPQATNFHQQAQFSLAKLGLKGIFWLIFALCLMLFLLLVFRIQNAELFKEVLVAFITFASGAVGGIFGYYFRAHEEGNNVKI